jgi:hypothetical protein
MASATTQDKASFSALGIGAATCIACCAPLILAFVGGLGLASSAWFGIVGVGVAVLAVIGTIVLRRQMAASGDDDCATDAPCGCC